MMHVDLKRQRRVCRHLSFLAVGVVASMGPRTVVAQQGSSKVESLSVVSATSLLT